MMHHGTMAGRAREPGALASSFHPATIATAINSGTGGERAALGAHARGLQAHGVSQRQAAQQLHGPRTTRQAWQAWQDTLASCPQGAPVFQSGPGWACLHRLVFALPLICVEVAAGGRRVGCLLLTLPGLARFVAASYGVQQQVNVQVEHAMVAYQHTATSRVAKAMPRHVIPMPQDETCTGSLGLVASEPVRHCMLLEPLAQARDPATWHALMAPALAPRHCAVMQSPSDEDQGLNSRVLKSESIFFSIS
jgi:hypothetical protein